MPVGNVSNSKQIFPFLKRAMRKSQGFLSLFGNELEGSKGELKIPFFTKITRGSQYVALHIQGTKKAPPLNLFRTSFLIDFCLLKKEQEKGIKLWYCLNNGFVLGNKGDIQFEDLESKWSCIYFSGDAGGLIQLF